MGRRKIEIRAIKDDRNRSVTFLKRKGGLFKKAHELSVLCSVDVAVIIFGHNKKLYEFSSGDINETLRRYNYYGQPHEHKGPADFKNKGGDDDDEDEDEDDVQNIKEDSLPPPPPPPQHPGLPPHRPPHNSFPHMTPPSHPSASPPIPNGMFQARHGTPQPHIDSRPGSRNTVRRTSSNLVPMTHQHHTPPAPPPPQPPQNGYAYVPNPPLYNPNAGGLPPQPSPQPQYQQFPQPPQQHQQPPQPPPHPQPQFMPQPQRPPSQPQMPRHDSLQPPPQHPVRTSPQPQQQEFKVPEPSPPQVRHISSKSRSIFTPIDEGGSVLAQHFFGAPDPPPPPPSAQAGAVKVDISPEIQPPPRSLTTQPQLPKPSLPAPQPARPSTTSAEFPPPQRSDTSGSRSGARPKLNLQIPDASDGESAVGGSPGAQPSATASANPANGRTTDHIVLPPPSPSASAVLSAGASGPPNPFARPPPPTSNNQSRESYADSRNNIETPISALPSRYMSNELLPSPSNFFSEWGDFSRNGGGLNSAVLPSPLTFPTPAEVRNPGLFERSSAGAGDAGAEGKRKSGDGLVGEEAKRVKI